MQHMLQPGQSGGPLLVADDVLHDGRGQGHLAQLGREALDQLKDQNEDCSEDLMKILILVILPLKLN